MFDVLVHRLPMEHVIVSCEVGHRSGRPSTSPAPTMALSSQIGRERALEKALAPIKDRYDYILIDTPPSLGLLTVNAFVAATGVIVPVQTEYLSLRGLVQLENTLTMVRENLNPRVEIVGIVPTMYDKRLTHSREADEILRENFGEPGLQHAHPQDDPIRRGSGQGRLRARLRAVRRGCRMYRDLAKEVLSGQKSRQHA